MRGSRPTMQHVADLAGVSLKTVSRVVNGRYGVAPATLDRVRPAAAWTSAPSSREQWNEPVLKAVCDRRCTLRRTGNDMRLMHPLTARRLRGRLPPCASVGPCERRTTEAADRLAKVLAHCRWWQLEHLGDLFGVDARCVQEQDLPLGLGEQVQARGEVVGQPLGGSRRRGARHPSSARQPAASRADDATHDLGERAVGTRSDQ